MHQIVQMHALYCSNTYADLCQISPAICCKYKHLIVTVPLIILIMGIAVQLTIYLANAYHNYNYLTAFIGM